MKKPKLVAVNGIKCPGSAKKIRTVDSVFLSHEKNKVEIEALVRNFSDGSSDVFCPQALEVGTRSNGVPNYFCQVIKNLRLSLYPAKYEKEYNFCPYCRGKI